MTSSFCYLDVSRLNIDKVGIDFLEFICYNVVTPKERRESNAKGKVF